MAFESYRIDRDAQELVQQYYREAETRNQVYKMRTSVAYGLERFWGEQFRLKGNQSAYWRETWETLVRIMGNAGIIIPNLPVEVQRDNRAEIDPVAVRAMAEQLWDFPIEERKIAIAVLTQLCDCMVWWTQRYKKLAGGNNEND